uniref:hypothetical protein n=1 Tax=Chamaesiphon sp. OTE_20_metabat_361 TaxID=2964689 RepID=UPI00286B6A6F
MILDMDFRLKTYRLLTLFPARTPNSQLSSPLFGLKTYRPLTLFPVRSPLSELPTPISHLPSYL